jgi:Lar family restriction alleviation protein
MTEQTRDLPQYPLIAESNDKIKECPFCGNDKVCVRLSTGFTVQCLQCGASLPTSVRDKIDDAIAIWNTRATITGKGGK